ncbi:MAG: hypothetical protein ACOX8E_04860 [Ruminococcus sp.]|jgi:hypothetical protein
MAPGMGLCMKCDEADLCLNDGAVRMFLNTHGRNPETAEEGGSDQGQ